MGKIIVGVAIALLAGASTPWWWCKVFSCTDTLTTPMESSSLPCREICQAQGAYCVRTKVPSQTSGVADCNFTGVKGELRSKACVCRTKVRATNHMLAATLLDDTLVLD